ncbi:MAG: aminopeptidase P family protein [Methanotrichaceae archaeon]|nr:aminopeptidase P family protein [Methanotrichaceae archaeon]
MEYVVYPKSEVEARIERLQSRMGAIAGVILFGSVNVCYFSGTAQEGLVYVPRDSEPVVMMRKSLERAREESPLDVLPLKSTRTLKEDLGISKGSTIGLELDILPYNNYSRVAKALGDVEIVDISEMIRHIRSVKSDFEIDLLREAAGIVDAGIASVADHLSPGMREIELAARVESVMRNMGHQGIIRFRRFNHEVPLGHLMAGGNAAIPSFVASPTGGQGLSLLNPQGPGKRRIRRGEPVLVDFGGVYNGYTADETRIFSIGALPQMLEDAHLAAVQVEEAVLKALRPGRTGREIFEISEEMGEFLGYAEWLGGPTGAKCGFVGHGVGLELDEYPVIGPLDHRIEPGMTVAVEPKMIYPGLGVVGVEDTVLTTANACERLTRLPREIWRA